MKTLSIDIETYSSVDLAKCGVSLLENSAHLGLPVPDKLKDVLQQLHNKEVN